MGRRACRIPSRMLAAALVLAAVVVFPSVASALDWRVGAAADRALTLLGDRGWGYDSLRFCEDAMIDGAGVVPAHFKDAATAGGVLGASANRTGIPPRGAWVFFHWYGTVDGTWGDHGIAGISLGDGRMVASFPGAGVYIRRIDCTGHCYIGWAAPPILPPVPDWVSVHAHDAGIVCPACKGFARGGTPTLWKCGLRGAMCPSLYAFCNGETRDAWASWTFDLERLRGCGCYKVEAYIPRGYSTTGSARYAIHWLRGVTTVTVDQSWRDDVWVDLGTYAFIQGEAWVELTDATGEPYSGGVSPVVAFDCVRLTPSCGDEGIAAHAAVPVTATGTATASVRTSGREQGPSRSRKARKRRRVSPR